MEVNLALVHELYLCIFIYFFNITNSLTPTNLAFLRVQTGMFDPSQVGDKSKWFAHTLTPIRFSVWDDGSSLNGALRSLKQHENQPTDESGSDSEGAESTSSSYSSLSDFVSEMVSSDLSPSLQEIYGGTAYHHHVINQSVSLVDPKLVYRPPSKLQYPEGHEEVEKIEEDFERPDSAASSSSSRSDLSSPSFNRDSEFEFNPKTKNETQTTRQTEKEEVGSFESENSSSITTTKTTIHKEGEAPKKRVIIQLDIDVLMLIYSRIYFFCYYRFHHQSVPILQNNQAWETFWHVHHRLAQQVHIHRWVLRIHKGKVHSHLYLNNLRHKRKNL